jgi:mannose-6-phosphate isomerase-like protein (cupin superfamily)
MTIRKFKPGYGWDAVDVLAYKNGDGPYKDVTRQTLFHATDALGAEWRYFDVATGGHSTLERHEHVHNVLILRGRGSCLVGSVVQDIGEHDLIHVPSLTWHQFRAAGDAPLGFLCLVNGKRDRPQLPTPDDVIAMRRDTAVAAFIRL